MCHTPCPSSVRGGGLSLLLNFLEGLRSGRSRLPIFKSLEFAGLRHLGEESMGLLGQCLEGPGVVSRVASRLWDTAGRGLYDAHVEMLSGAVRAGCLGGLRHLTLAYNFFLGKKGIEALMCAFCDLPDKGREPSLEWLDVRCTRAGGGIGSVCAALESGGVNKKINLRFSRSRVDDCGMERVREALERGSLSGMRGLDFSFGTFRGEKVVGLLRAVCSRGLPGLENLCLSGSTKGDKGAAERLTGVLLEALETGSLPTLVELGVASCELGDSFLLSLAESVSSCCWKRKRFPLQLSSLDLSANSLSAQGISAFFDALQGNSAAFPRLKCVLLEGNCLNTKEKKKFYGQVQSIRNVN
uniref:Uncharacterized protein n=1 Tax=Chromera velia CCMP2878 TaxID=1169474 RepID=A0A0G4HDY4_9ALVE|eukprot:Cvel_26630.t1-p1 / transcript=Cvel_26630.t1 / gene=Cvel_26630 / organism=Chromera_velia_CCMP2878 / gene_product=hypothetical protein / transcript_product=hypothetical protein / location=Cvel_scaffold3199:9862-14983(+) / protein_length=355 / sequence_SO=supercontig / SO=protein_coding / is_pseudo=false